MKIYSVIFTYVAIFINHTNSENVKYTSWIRNLTVSSETNSVYLMNFETFRNYTGYRTWMKQNVTKDIHVNHIQVKINRCVYEKSMCEYFQKWQFTDPNLIKRFAKMKNQMWSPLFTDFKPPVDFSFVRRAVYENPNLHLDAEEIMKFYAEALNYYFQTETILFDDNNKEAYIINLDIVIRPTVEQDIKRDFKNSKKKNHIEKS